MPDQSQILKGLYSSIKNISNISDENWRILTSCSIVTEVPKGGFLLKTIQPPGGTFLCCVAQG
jgi:hypothetical protein